MKSVEYLVRNKVGTQLYHKVEDQVSGQVWDQVWRQVWRQTWDQVYDKGVRHVEDQVWKELE
jgi:hypothetical protein